MSKVKDTQSKTFGSIAAVQTIADNYPSLKNTNSIMVSLDVGTSLGYMLALLRVMGVTETDIYDWLSKLLCGKSLWAEDIKSKSAAAAEKAAGGILDVIEYAIKTLLFANIKDLFGGCPIDVMIPDWMIEGESAGLDGQSGLKINLAMIDTFGTLQACPCDETGSIFYFDTVPNIYGDKYNVNDVYKSSDFNAFLWHVVNKSGAEGDMWDNRVNVQQNLLASLQEDEETGEYTWPLREKFFDPKQHSGKIKDTVKNQTITKKEIIRCRYLDTGNVTDGDGLIKVTLPKERYRYQKNGFYINRTIFEFNYDYIFSLKLFDAKTLVANIINSLLSLSTTIGVGISFEKNVIKQEVSAMVKNIMAADSDEDEETETCVAKFSNEQFDNSIKLAEMARDGVFEMAGRKINSAEIDVEKIVNKIKKISESEDQRAAIEDAIKTASSSASDAPEISVDMKFACDISFIYNFLQQTVTEIVTQILSPKVTMLYAINSAMMGDISDLDGWKNNFTYNSIDELLLKLRNLITNIIRQCLDLILKELFRFLMDKLGPLIKIFTMQLLLETIKDYKDLILQLITACSFNFNLFSYDSLNVGDVQYADIVPSQTTPGNNKCK